MFMTGRGMGPANPAMQMQDVMRMLSPAAGFQPPMGMSPLAAMMQPGSMPMTPQPGPMPMAQPVTMQNPNPVMQDRGRQAPMMGGPMPAAPMQVPQQDTMQIRQQDNPMRVRQDRGAGQNPGLGDQMRANRGF